MMMGKGLYFKDHESSYSSGNQEPFAHPQLLYSPPHVLYITDVAFSFGRVLSRQRVYAKS